MIERGRLCTAPTIAELRRAIATTRMPTRDLESPAEKGQLLGNDVSDLYLEDRMAGKVRLRDFVCDPQSKSERAADAEHDALVKFTRDYLDDQTVVLEPWDLGYYAEKLRQKSFDFDEEALPTWARLGAR